MKITWTAEALADLEHILIYYHEQVGPVTAKAVECRIVSGIENLRELPGQIRASDRIPGARELVVNRLPYIVFVKALPDQILVLNIAHIARSFPA